ncbi:MAG TPA: DUF4476 domain-containing protein [Bacteroidales bacterium]|nr:hypothetical protein [Bacteroidales bacterium]HQH59027.1 DUF4476 domain-containing protein [Bacteroidales bacterium]HRC78432.1 DUF4476 domain-containing protein [Bacteroidales bacterium]
MKTKLFFLIFIINLSLFSAELSISIAPIPTPSYVYVNGRLLASGFSPFIISKIPGGLQNIEIYNNVGPFNTPILQYKCQIYINFNEFVGLKFLRNGHYIIEDRYNLHPEHPHGNNPGHHYGHDNYNPYHGQYFTYTGMYPETFNSLCSVLQNQSFDSNKLIIAKDAILKNGINASQLRILLSYFSFDSNRLELAKYAYPYVVDPQNAFMITDAFTFSSSAREFMEFINH